MRDIARPKESAMTRRPFAAGLLAAASTVAVLAVAAPADAARAARPKVELSTTTGSFFALAGGALLSAQVEGRPFAGEATATLLADDGSPPEPGRCEPATVSFGLDGPARRFISAVATGELCGEDVQPPYIVTHVFTGRYEVTDSSRRVIVGSDGFLEVRLGEDGSASLFLIDT
jgi:hypothetical protein